jgi:hypothetical protein
MTMSEEEFAKLTLAEKWAHVVQVMEYILKMEQSYSGTLVSYGLRRRYNPHHAKEQVDQESKAIKEHHRNLRIDQYQRWAHIKGLYSNHRDEMTNTLENEKYSEYKNILESVFTMEVDDALRDIIGDDN